MIDFRLLGKINGQLFHEKYLYQKFMFEYFFHGPVGFCLCLEKSIQWPLLFRSAHTSSLDKHNSTHVRVKKFYIVGAEYPDVCQHIMEKDVHWHLIFSVLLFVNIVEVSL